MNSTRFNNKFSSSLLHNHDLTLYCSQLHYLKIHGGHKQTTSASRICCDTTKWGSIRLKKMRITAELKQLFALATNVSGFKMFAMNWFKYIILRNVFHFLFVMCVIVLYYDSFNLIWLMLHIFDSQVGDVSVGFAPWVFLPMGFSVLSDFGYDFFLNLE